MSIMNTMSVGPVIFPASGVQPIKLDFFVKLYDVKERNTFTVFIKFLISFNRKKRLNIKENNSKNTNLATLLVLVAQLLLLVLVHQCH